MEYQTETEGIRVAVRPRFSLAQSDFPDGTYVFAYEVEMHNGGSVPAQLLFRHWHIHDSAGDDTVVDGEGVVGQQPVLPPGASHRYSSYCVLRSPLGYMEGHYTFTRPGHTEFRVAIPRFDLRAPFPPPASEESAARSN